ncbi:MAG: TolC family protein [Gemmatimonadota bacterium]|nr:TolC family protein [Gemmatimonadota bacterium]
MKCNSIARLVAVMIAAAALPAACVPLIAQDSSVARGPTQLTIGDAARLAARNNASPQGALVRVAEARARVQESRADLLPSLNGSASQFARTINTASFGFSLPGLNPNGQIIGPFHNLDLRGSAVAPLLNLGAFARVRAAGAAVTASTAEATVASEQAAAQAALAYVQALRSEDDLRARSEDSVLAADLVGVAQAQLQAGTGVALDVTRAQAQLAQTRASLISSRAARDRARIAFARAINVPVRTPIVLSDSLSGMDTTSVTTDETAAVQTALQHRPDIRAAQARAAAARQGVSAIRAEWLPSISLVGDDGANGLSVHHLLNTYEYGVSVSVPILDGFRRSGRVQEQQGVAREAEIQQRDLEQQADADVSSAILDLRAAQQQVQATREQLRFSDQEVSQARERFRAGVAGNADVITALLQLTTARTAVIDAQTNFQTARVALARAQGLITTLP